MRPRVTAIVVARSGAEYLQSTLQALAAQTRRPDQLIVVDLGSTPESARLIAAAGPTQHLTAPDRASFGEAVREATKVAAAPPSSDDDWLWLLAADNAPDPDALAQLLAAVEISPSVVVAGPKQMQWADPDYLLSFGETMTRNGTAVELAEPELDQGQYDRHRDVMAVAAGGMLVRHTVWEQLGGFDPGLPAVDDALDFCVRARLAGWRVSLVPAARVLSAGRHAPGTAILGRRTSRSRRASLARSAQLHRRLVYAPAPAVPLHWLSLLPLALLRAVGQLLRKAPGAVLGEFAAALATAFGSGTRIFAARRRLARNRQARWSALAPLRQPWRDVRHRRALLRDSAGISRRGDAPELRFLASGGLWTVLVAAVVGLVAFGGFLGASALTGGGLLPLADLGTLWGRIGYGWRDLGIGFRGAADPFTVVLAVLGSLTFWAPSFSVVLLYLSALPLAALAAWVAAARLTPRSSVRALAAALWTLAPPFLVALDEGRLAPVIVHLLLPWLVVAALGARRSWSAAATTALLAAAITASAPSLLPVLGVLWLTSMLAAAAAGRAGRGWHRLLPVPLPALALFAPLLVQQLLRGNLLAVLADPGLPQPAAPFNSSLPTGLSVALHLAAALPQGSGLGWSGIAGMLGAPLSGFLVSALFLAPLVGLALIALLLPGASRVAPALLVAATGYATAVAATRLQFTGQGAEPVSVWAGSALSLYWLGLTGAVVLALRAAFVRSAAAEERRTWAAVAARTGAAATAAASAATAANTGAAANANTAAAAAIPETPLHTTTLLHTPTPAPTSRAEARAAREAEALRVRPPARSHAIAVWSAKPNTATRILAALAGIAMLGVTAASLPLLLAPVLGDSPVTPSTGRTLPALVAAEAERAPLLGTLVLTPQSDGGLSGQLVRGTGATLDQQSTLAATASNRAARGDGAVVSPPAPNAATDPGGPLAALVGNLAARSGYDPTPELTRLGIGFVLLTPGTQPLGAGIANTTAAALNGNPAFTPIAATPNGTLWRYTALDAGALSYRPPSGATNLGTPVRTALLAGQGLIFGLTLLLALPTGGIAERMRPERSARRGSGISRRGGVRPGDAVAAATGAAADPDSTAVRGRSQWSDPSVTEPVAGRFGSAPDRAVNPERELVGVGSVSAWSHPNPLLGGDDDAW